MDRIIGLVERVVLAIPRFLYRRVVAEEQRREAGRGDWRAIRDALIEAETMMTMEVSTTPKWYATREASVRAAGLASAASDQELRDLVRAYKVAHDAVAEKWTYATAEQRRAVTAAFDGAMDRIAVLLGNV